jgi:hypothetical protein
MSLQVASVGHMIGMLARFVPVVRVEQNRTPPEVLPIRQRMAKLCLLLHCHWVVYDPDDGVAYGRPGTMKLFDTLCCQTSTYVRKMSGPLSHAHIITQLDTYKR